MAEELKTYEDLTGLLLSAERTYDLDMIDQAYHLAVASHKGQVRRSGAPYVSHPIAAACILVELGMDSESVAAGLLHDVVEDTDVTLEQIQKQFGASVAHLIDGVTKLGKIPYTTREQQQAENIRKMLMAMADDVRVIIIKMADRLHNMRTIEFMKPQKQRDKALENMEVFAPIADRLGIRTVKEELEDLSLRYLDPMGYEEIERKLALRQGERADFIVTIKRQLSERLAPLISDFHLEGRVKSINGIYRKMFMQDKGMDEIFDIFAIRVIVNTVSECYSALGVVHDLFRPIPNRLKDYISIPKPNLYQSLHTTVLSKEGIPFEVQIRTWEMHHMAEYGIAAHWKYKLGITKRAGSLDQRLSWVRKVLDNEKDSDDATDLVYTIKSDLSQDTVFVFTPNGDVISLPVGSTVIDFAYAIHSAVGNRMIGAKVDKRIVPLDYRVQNGQIVEIMTTKEIGKGPSRDWLKIVKTSEARNKIRQWFKKERREENVQEGRAEVEREFRRSGMTVNDEELMEMMAAAAKRHNCSTVEDLYCAIGYGGIQLAKVLPKIKEEYFKHKNPVPPHSLKITDASAKKSVTGVLVDGMDNCLIKFSKCCNPLPGDEIIGFITRGYGVSIHKKECGNVPDDLALAPQPERWVAAHWVGDVTEDFQTTLHIVADTRTGLLMEITQQLYNLHILVHSLNSRRSKDGQSVIVTATITIHGKDHLQTVINRLSNIPDIVSIRRS